MKKIVMTLVAMIATATMNAQDMYVGGTAGLSTDGNNNRELYIAPEWGMKLDDKLGFGLRLNYGYGKEENAFGTTSTTDITVNPYLRYDFAQIGKLKVFVDGGVYFGTSKTDDFDANNNFGLNVVPGVAYNITDNWSIVALANNVFSWNIAAPAHSHCRHDISLFEDFGINTFRFGFFYNF